MKYKCIVEYEYPIEHKPPVKAEIVLHGDRVYATEIKPLPKRLEIIKEIETEIYKRSWEDKNGVQIVVLLNTMDIIRKVLRKYI